MSTLESGSGSESSLAGSSSNAAASGDASGLPFASGSGSLWPTGTIPSTSEGGGSGASGSDFGDGGGEHLGSPSAGSGCAPGFGGPDCLPCKQNVYTGECMTTCDHRTTCNAHGRCEGSTGKCTCFPGWAGNSCNGGEGEGSGRAMGSWRTSAGTVEGSAAGSGDASGLPFASGSGSFWPRGTPPTTSEGGGSGASGSEFGDDGEPLPGVACTEVGSCDQEKSRSWTLSALAPLEFTLVEQGSGARLLQLQIEAKQPEREFTSLSVPSEYVQTHDDLPSPGAGFGSIGEALGSLSAAGEGEGSGRAIGSGRTSVGTVEGSVEASWHPSASGSGSFLPTTPPVCMDDSTFIDANGFYCVGWRGYDCSSSWPSYSEDEISAVQSACPLACNLCSGGGRRLLSSKSNGKKNGHATSSVDEGSGHDANRELAGGAGSGLHTTEEDSAGSGSGGSGQDANVITSPWPSATGDRSKLPGSAAASGDASGLPFASGSGSLWPKGSVDEIISGFGILGQRKGSDLPDKSDSVGIHGDEIRLRVRNCKTAQSESIYRMPVPEGLHSIQVHFDGTTLSVNFHVSDGSTSAAAMYSAVVSYGSATGIGGSISENSAGGDVAGSGSYSSYGSATESGGSGGSISEDSAGGDGAGSGSYTSYGSATDSGGSGGSISGTSAGGDGAGSGSYASYGPDSRSWGAATVNPAFANSSRWGSNASGLEVETFFTFAVKNWHRSALKGYVAQPASASSTATCVQVRFCGLHWLQMLFSLLGLLVLCTGPFTLG